MIVKYGQFQVGAVINLLANPGNELLMPKGIPVLVELIKKSPKGIPLLSHKFSEKLVYRAYEHSLEKIKGDKQILTDYLWLLEQLVLEGSSDAYWIREFLISFAASTK